MINDLVIERSEEHAKKVHSILLDSKSIGDYPNDVTFRMGDIYCKAMERCLKGNFESINSSVNETSKDHVIGELARCVV